MRRFYALLIVAITGVLLMTACAAPAATPTGDSAGSAESAEAAYEGSALEAAKNGAFEGAEVSVFTVWVEAEGEKFESALADFTEQTGIAVSHEGSADFETLITVRTEAGDPPDVAIFPQPALMASLARDGYTVDLSQFLDAEMLQSNFSEGLLELGSVDGVLTGIPYRASTKSLVWYPKAKFDEAGYTVPTTWEELQALQDQMVTDGIPPWCISIEHSGATGWVATDWLEEIVLRTAGPEVYDQWVAHEIPFNDPAILDAAKIMGDIWFNPDLVYGGTNFILTTFVGDAPTPMFNEPPSCWFHRQAGWIPEFFPEDAVAETDYAFFYFPPIDDAQGSPVLGAGDFAAMFNDRPEVRALIEFLASPEGAEAWITAGGFISPNQGVPLEWYTSMLDQAQAEILQNATTLRFDASDMMPAEVGTGTFWTGMVDWISGEDLESVFAEIEDGWPSE